MVLSYEEVPGTGNGAESMYTNGNATMLRTLQVAAELGGCCCTRCTLLQEYVHHKGEARHQTTWSLGILEAGQG